MHHHHIEEDELEASHQEKIDCLFLETSTETARVQRNAYKERLDEIAKMKFEMEVSYCETCSSSFALGKDCVA